MGRSEDPAEKDDRGREIGNHEGAPGLGQPHADQEKGDDRNPEELEDAFHPDVDHEPPPVIGHGEMRSSAKEEPEAEEPDHQNGAEKIKDDQGAEFTLGAFFQEVPQWPINDQEPGDQPDKEQDLPELSQFQELPSLMTDPEPPLSQEPLDPGDLTEKASSRHDEDGAEQKLDEKGLLPGLNPADDGGQVDGGPDPGGGDPEDGQLQVPALGPAVGDNRGHDREIESSPG